MMQITQIPQTIRNVNRFREIVQVVAKHGFGDVVARLGLDTVINTLTFQFRRRGAPALPTEKRIRMAIEELGATFIKLGQVLATRPDLIPMSLIKELRGLQDDVKPVGPEAVAALLTEEFGEPAEDVFAEFSPTPLAAASIGQVHRAKLKSGEEVVLKVQRPGLESQIETDLSIMRWVARLLHENVPELRRYDPLGIVAEFEISIVKEIDFMREAAHIRRFARNFRADERVYVPKVYDRYTTARVLCEEFIHGMKADAEELIAKPLEQRERIATNGIDCILQQTFVHGFFHADPHPGNIFIVEADKVCFVDYGMMGNLDDERIDELLSFLVAILSRNPEGVVALFHRLDLVPEEFNERALRTDLMDLLERYGSLELKRLDIGAMLTDVFDVISRHDITVPSDLLLVGKALATIDGVARAIYPELEPLDTIRPKVLQIYLGRLSDPRRLTRTPRRIAQSTYELMQTLPRDLQLTMRKLRTGALTTNTRNADLPLLLLAYNRAQNRMFLSIIVAALVIASASLLGGSEQLIELPYVPSIALKTVMGLVLFGLSVVYGLVLLIGFIRSDGV